VTRSKTSKELTSLIQRARAEHDAAEGASSSELSAAENRLGYRLADDLKVLLRAANGIRFWVDGDYPCRLLSAAELQPVRGLLQNDEGPNGIIALIDAGGDFVGVDLEPGSASFGRFVDCFHETFPDELPGVCDSLAALLTLILESDGDEWLWPAALAYDVDFAE
jgi:SMI1 / KNR4 family (SUKH-1)